MGNREGRDERVVERDGKRERTEGRREGRREIGKEGSGWEISPPRSFLKVGAYASLLTRPDRQQFADRSDNLIERSAQTTLYVLVISAAYGPELFRPARSISAQNVSLTA